MILILHGIGVARGVVKGGAYIPQRAMLEIREYTLHSSQIEEETTRYLSAVRTARQQLQTLRQRIPPGLPVDILALVDVHLLMLEDHVFTAGPLVHIEQRRCNAEWALRLQRDVLVRSFDDIEDPYLRARKDDVEHVVRRILLALHDRLPQSNGASVRGAVIFADDLEPAEVILLYHQGVAALVTESGGYTSHTAILARSLALPLIAGVHRARDYVRHGEQVVVDGERGMVFAGVAECVTEYFRARRRGERRHQAALDKLRKCPAVTRDGVPISLQANIELPTDIIALERAGAQGVGLYRTEFLFLNRDMPPDEEEQIEAYTHVVKALKGAPVTIRTLDLGMDKEVGGRYGAISPGLNPALGLRAIRRCLKEPALFRPQLRAILRASHYGPVRLMIPMLATVVELRQVLRLLEEVKRELSVEGVAYDEHMAVGAMIEIPAAAMAVDTFAPHLSFFSIGTNDLIQYAMATDRLDDEVNYLYDPLHPGVIRLIQHVIAVARTHATPVSMCGEMAGDTRYTRLLLGMGLSDFSMHSASLLEVKRVVQASTVASLERLVRRIVQSADTDEIVDLVDKLNTVE